MRSDIDGRLQIPAGMKSKLEAYQQSVRKVKLAEGILAAVFGLLLSYMLVFALDRVMETPGWLRGLILVTGALGLGLFFPLKCHKWVWGTRRMEQVAKLLRHKFPRTSDQLLGIVELARSESEQSRSPVLVQAAMNQVDESIKDRDFSSAVPDARHRSWAWAAAIPALLIIGAVVFSQAATSNAFVRWLMPWKETERYTFAKVDDLPDQIVVPTAEQFRVETKLRQDTEWSPESGYATYKDQKTIRTDQSNGGYSFNIPPQTEAGSLAVSIGDIRKSIAVKPMARPELQALGAVYTLPDYLQYANAVEADASTGVVSVLTGTTAQFRARISRHVKSASLDGKEQSIEDVDLAVRTEDYVVDHSLPIEAFTGNDGSLPVVKLVEWHKEPGDHVVADDILCTVSVQGKETPVTAGVTGRIRRLSVSADSFVARDQTVMEVASKVAVAEWKAAVGDEVTPRDIICDLVVTDPASGEDQIVQHKAGDYGTVKSHDVGTDQVMFEVATIATLTDRRIVTDEIVTADMVVGEPRDQPMEWTDTHGLSSREPFVLKINALEDSAPVIGCELLDQQRVILATDTVKFDLNVSDDFGVRKVGLEWQGVEDALRNPNPAQGERVVSAGAPETRDINTIATFCANTEGLKPQSFKVRAYAEDYMPDRERTYSAVYTLHVLSEDEHFAWMTEQMSRWLRQAEGVYEQELRLHDENNQLRQMTPEELEAPKTRRKIQQQAAAERANGARLSALTANGKRMVEEATRNEQFQVGHLETWAEQLQKLEKMAANRMPNVADLLSDALKPNGQPQASDGKNEKATPNAGQNKGNQSGKPGESSDKEGPENKAPSVSDTESGMNKQDENGGDEPPKPPTKGKLGLPQTVLQGGPPSEPEACEPQEDIEEAAEEQAEILAEFEEIKDALNDVMGELENSTFVKRLKAASRRQLEVAGDLNRTLIGSFGQAEKSLEDRQKNRASQLAKREVAQSENVYLIQQDLEAYFNRKQETKFKEILDDMSDTRVVTKLRGLGDRITGNLKGESIVRAEFWADTLDRWAEELVQPAPGGA